MPNHLHAVLFIEDDVPPQGRDELLAGIEDHPARLPRSVGSLVAGFKAMTTKRINEVRQTPRLPAWQRNYYEHIVRSEEELRRIEEYIANNPLNWALDTENPEVVTQTR